MYYTFLRMSRLAIMRQAEMFRRTASASSTWNCRKAGSVIKDISRVRQHAVLLRLNARVRVRFENEVTVIVNDIKGRPSRLTRHESIVLKKKINNVVKACHGMTKI